MTGALAPHVFLVAGEESGDRLGAALIAAIRRASQGRARFSGVGGAHMAGEGVPSLFPLGDLAIMGFATIPASLPKILRRIRETADAVIAAKPDVLVIIDSPEFTHRVARKVRARNAAIPILDYVCPSVWAWRPGRARAMRPYVDQVLALLPFEPEAMQRLHGPPYHLRRSSARRADRRVASECRRGAPPHGRPAVAAGAAGQPVGRDPPHGGRVRRCRCAASPNAPGRSKSWCRRCRGSPTRCARHLPSWRIAPRVVTEAAEKHAAFRQARAALTKSGTSTLELALAGVPMAAAYKVPLVEEAVGRLLITAPSAILANLILGENVVPEFLQRDCTAEKLAAAILPLLSDSPQRRRQTEAFSRLDRLMGLGQGAASERAASLVLASARAP